MPTHDEVDTSHPIFRVHRIGAVLVAAVLWVFGILGFLGHPGFLSTRGTNVLGMTCNGLLATISLVMGAILIVAAVRVGSAASTAAVVIGALFVLSGLLNLIVLHRSINFLAFTMPNVIFSLVVGIALLFIGLYGRASGQLPADNPFRAAHGGQNRLATVWHGESMTKESSVASPEDAERRLDEIDELAEAEHAMAEGTASPQQEREVIADSAARARQRRRDNWRRAARERRS
jgi:hypothetical protein